MIEETCFRITTDYAAREKLKQELDKLNSEQLQKIADFIALIEFQAGQVQSSTPFWQRATRLGTGCHISVSGFLTFLKPVIAFPIKPSTVTAFTRSDAIPA